MHCGYQHYCMAIKYIKKASKTPETDDHKTQAAVQTILNDIKERKELALEEAKKLESLILNIEVPVSEEGTLYGSIGTREITDSLAEKGIDLEKSSIRLPEGTLKEVGEYSIDIELHPEVVQGIKVGIAAKEEI